MPSIEQLPSSVVNKIAAGEVIERTASVVKELMENSIDSGASRIDVSVEAGGSELVRVSDDGCGIAAEELTLAVASHATSKIRTAEELFRVGTLGFRGEALASIAEVSRLWLRSRRRDDEAGAEMEIIGGRAGPVSPCGAPPGSTIEVRQLFFNTPVRRKFLKTTQTEMGHITEAFTRLALAHPHLHCTLRHNQRVLHDLPPTTCFLERIAAFFGQDLAGNLIAVESHDEPVRLSGYVAHPSHSRSHTRMQYLFLNGRHIRDRSLQHALGEAYRGLLLGGRYPISFLWFDMPAEQVDVNVHPTKLEVRFQDGGRLYSQLLGTLRTRFLTTDLNARLDSARAADTGGEPGEAHDPGQTARLRQELVDWAKGEVAHPADASTTPAATATAPSAASHEMPAFGQTAHAPLSLNPLPPGDPSQFGGTSGARPSPTTTATHPPADSASPASRVSALQVHNRYLIAETDEGMVVIDQHALHERILYEQLREKVLAGAVETQNLLVPEPVDLTSEEAAAVLDQSELLAKLGMAVESFGGDTVLVRGYPAMLSNIRPDEVLRGLIESLVVEGKSPQRRDVLDELLHMIACKAAIKAGDRLNPDEITALLQQRHLVHDAHHCPHGRPTALVFTREDLDRQFKRT